MRPIKIGANVWIGLNAVILDGVAIGDRSGIGAGSAVTKDTPPDCVAVGHPCRVIKTITHSEMPADEELDEMWADLHDFYYQQNTQLNNL